MLNVIFEAVHCMCTSHTIPTQTSSPLTLQTSTNVCRRLRTDNTIQWHFNVSIQIVNVVPPLCFSNLKLQKRGYDCIGAPINDLWTRYFIWLWFHIATLLQDTHNVHWFPMSFDKPGKKKERRG